jgi:type IV pilus assembly protein PilB
MYGEKIVLRILDPSSATLGIDMLGYDPDQKELLLEAIQRPYGMVLVTGPTGSGKTVSLYTCLNILNKPGINISTAEDPAEIALPGINQVNVDDRQGLTFPVALKAFLRQDPDIIMVGEIRDLETAQIAVKAALTGHLVLSTLHTNDAPSTVDRLINMGVEPFLLTSSINLVAAQRLVRRICDKCKEPVEVAPEALVNLGVDAAEAAGGFPTFRGHGCSSCNGSGYRGRLAIYEILVMHEGLKELVLKAASAAELKREAVKSGMSTLRMSALQKVRDGLTTVEETLRVTDTDKGFGSVFSLGF